MQQQQKQVIDNDFDMCVKAFFDQPATMILIVGDWKTGKTDFSLLLAERMLKLGIVQKVASNIETKGDNTITFISDLPTLKDWLYGDRTRKLYIFDEAGLHVHRRRSMSAKNIAILTLMPEISKAHARLILILHNLEALDKELTSTVWCKGLIEKDNKYHARFISFTKPLLNEEFSMEFYPVPRTNIPFDPYAIAPFKLTRPTQIPLSLKDKELQILWEWSVNNKSVVQLGLHPQQLNRIVRPFVKKVLQEQASDVTIPR
jgi:hypothetical protein